MSQKPRHNSIVLRTVGWVLFVLAAFFLAAPKALLPQTNPPTDNYALIYLVGAILLIPGLLLITDGTSPPPKEFTPTPRVPAQAGELEVPVDEYPPGLRNKWLSYPAVAILTLVAIPVVGWLLLLVLEALIYLEDSRVR